MSEVVISNEAKELAEVILHINADCITEKDKIFIALPIDTIDGVYVSCYIRSYDAENEKIGLVYNIELEIYDDDCENISMYKHRSLPIQNLTKEYCEKFCQTIFTTLPLLKLHPVGGFVTHKTSRAIGHEKLETLFKNFDCNNITKSNLGECCVCYNRTDTKTCCKHSLCYRCWSKMVNDKDEDEEYVKCPICRQDL